DEHLGKRHHRHARRRLRCVASYMKEVPMLRRRPQNTVAPLALAAIVLLAACGGPTGSSEQGAATADPGASAQVTRQAPSDFSVYELESSWHEASDAEFPLSKL